MNYFQKVCADESKKDSSDTSAEVIKNVQFADNGKSNKTKKCLHVCICYEKSFVVHPSKN